MQTSIDRSSKFITSTSNFIWRQKAENYNNMFTFLHQTDKFIIAGDMATQTFWQWSDNIKPKDDITPFDGTQYLHFSQRVQYHVPGADTCERLEKKNPVIFHLNDLTFYATRWINFLKACNCNNNKALSVHALIVFTIFFVDEKITVSNF
jgi:hypothetical protein